MATEITVDLVNRPGALARFGEVLGLAGINIEAFVVTTGGDTGVVRFLADDTATAVRALEDDGLACRLREVLLVRVVDEPGALGELALVMADAGINIDSVYSTADGRAVLGVDDLGGALQVAQGMALT